MPEIKTITTAEQQGGPPASASAARDLGLAITALRRGEPVLIRDAATSVLAVAAELVGEENLQRLRQVAAGPAMVVLTRRRAVALGLAPREDLSGALAIPVLGELPAAVIRNLANPATSLGAEPPGLGPQPMVAQGAALAAVTLAKLAALLPAALVLRIGAAEAALLARRSDLAAIEAAWVFRRDAATSGLT
ncbi:MAG: hypothetical protein ACREE9_05430, partial [Stellaceae bacterium]